MLSVNREFQYLGELVIKKSISINKQSKPKDDQCNWLFLKIGVYTYSFVYTINKPNNATYNKPFLIEMAFTVEEEKIKEIIKIGENYEIYRGQEYIGNVIIINKL